MTLDSTLISRHMFRRTARRKAKRLRAQGIHAVVVPAARGPLRWDVREQPKEET